MNAILNYMAESLFVGLVLYLMLRLSAFKSWDYSFQRIVALVSVMAIALFPLLRITINDPLIAGYVLDPAYALSGGTMEETQENTSGIVSTIPLILFFLVATIVLVANILHFYRLYKFKKRSTMQACGDFFLYRSCSIGSPFSFGKSIFVPAKCEGDELAIVLAHEKSHIGRNHTADIIFVGLVTIVQWFNPFIYLFRRDLVAIHEYQADLDVLISGTDKTKYRELLLNYQFDMAPVFSNSLQKSLTHKRFIKMENLIQKKAGVKGVILFSAATMLLFSVTSFSKGSVSEESNEILEAASQSSMQTTPQDTSSQKVPFVMVEVKPKFMGGDENTFTKWVAERLVYPEKAKKESITGRVILQFMVTSKGKVDDVKIVRGVHPELDQEAIRVVMSSPDWEPGKEKGKNVNVVYTFPVIFMLGEKK
jgi:TonB family protein